MQVCANLQNFRLRLPVLHIKYLSNRCRHKYNPSISRIFGIKFSAVFFHLAQLWRAAAVLESTFMKGDDVVRVTTNTTKALCLSIPPSPFYFDS